MPADRLLVLLRHGQSEWNLKNLFTGWRDVDLTPAGVEEAKDAGRRMKAHGVAFDLVFTSALIRAQRTLSLALAEMGQTGLPEQRDQALNERDYGDLAGLNKDDARKKWGEEQVHKWRRSYDINPPGGESSKTRSRARFLIIARTSCPQFSAASGSWSRRMATLCARWSWCSTGSPPRRFQPRSSRRASRSFIA